MDPLATQDISRDPRIERLAEMKERHGDEYPIIFYEPNIECQKKKALKDLPQGRNSINLFSELKEVSKFVQSLGISFILIISQQMNEKTVIENFRGPEKFYGRRMFDFEEEALLKDFFQGISDDKIKSLELKAYVFISLLEVNTEALIDEDEKEIMVMCDLMEMAKKFRQDFAIIWFDPQVNSERKCKLEQEIGMKIEENRIFVDSEELYQKMKRRNEAKRILGEIDSFKDLLCLYIYDDNNPQKFLNKKVEIEKTLEELIPKIKEGFRTKSQLINTFPSFATHFDAADKSHSYFLHYYLKGLINFKNRKQAKGDFVKLAQKIYQDQLLEEFETEYAEYNGEKMLHWYTKDSPVYKLLNNCLRIASSDSILYSRFVLKDVEQAIRERYKHHSKDFSGLVYRGAYISTEEWEKLERNIGEEIEMYGFLSTTVNQRTAVNFFKGDPKNKIFVTIIVPPLPEFEEQGFADVSEFSEFQGEKEILFNVRSRFRILEAKIIRIDRQGTKGRHLVLFYGARSLRKYMTKHQPAINMELKLPIEKKCSLCASVSKLFALNQGVTEVRCLDCLIEGSVPKDIPLFALGSEDQTEAVKNLKGQILKFHQGFDFSNSDYKCQNCQKKGKVKYYKWIDVKTEKSFVQCSDCFKNKKETGYQVLIAESNPYAFWQECQKEWEKADVDYQAELSETVKYEDQGRVYEAVQRFDLCLEYERRVVIKSKRRRGREKEKLQSFLNIGWANEKCGKHQEALIYLQEVMDMTQRFFGEKHLKTGMALENLASVYHSLGDFQKALECHEQSLDITKTIFGDKNLLTATSYTNLAFLLRDLGRYPEALVYCIKARHIIKDVYGENHPKTAEVFNNIGAVLKYLGRGQDGLIYQKKALEIRRNVYGDKHPETAESYNNVAQVSESLGEYATALEYHKQALKIVEAIYGENHKTVAFSYNNLGLVYENLGEFNQAFECYKKSIDIKIVLFGENHSDVAISYSNLGSLCQTAGKTKNALEYLEKSQKIMEITYGDDHPETATLYNALGLAFRDLGQYQKALEFNKKALNIRKIRYGDQHPDTAGSYNNLGDVHLRLREFQKAREYFEKALSIHETPPFYNNLGSVYLETGQFQKALPYLRKAVEMSETASGDNHPDTAIFKLNLGLVSMMLGKRQEALEHFYMGLDLPEGDY